MRAAEPRRAASIMMNSSISASFGRGLPDWMKNTSFPRTLSLIWQNVSPSGKWRMSIRPSGFLRYFATFAANGALCVPAKTMKSFFLFMPVVPVYENTKPAAPFGRQTWEL